MEWEEEATNLVANVRQLRNTFNTAAELPSDIIVMIPSFLPEDFDSLALSHVCRRWRTIVNSAPLLWRRMGCRDLNRTVIGLEHLKSTSLRLKLNRNFSTDALNTALDRGCNIASVIADISLSQIQSFHKRLVTPSVEELVLFIYGDGGAAREGGEPTTVNIEGEFTSMRRLFISGCFLPIDRVAAANLIHLSLESFHLSTITAQSVLNMLRGCLRVETVLINTISGDSIRHPLQSYKPVTLPKLHSIELGHFEVCSGLIIPLHFPQGVAVGFRSMCYDEETWPCESIRHVLATINIESVAVSHIRQGGCRDNSYLLRFEGSEGSLEVTAPEQPGDSVFVLGKLLLSPSLRLEDVKTLRVTGCLYDILGVVESVLPNLISVQFAGPNRFPISLITEGRSPTPLPNLRHIAGRLAEKNLLHLARERKLMGMPLNSLSVNDGGDFWSRLNNSAEDALGDISELEEFVDVKVGKYGYCPEDWTKNAILDVWEDAGHRGPVSADAIEARAR